jgi:hypothetical protein
VNAALAFAANKSAILIRTSSLNWQTFPTVPS